MRFKVVLHREALKDYKKADKKLKTKIAKAIDSIMDNPFYGFHIKKLEGKLSDMYRYRLGDIRIVYEIHKDIKTIRVKTIEARGRVYKYNGLKKMD